MANLYLRLQTSKMNIIIINLHSARNLGDDAIMHETLSGLREIFPNANITLAATDPDSWRKYCQIPNIEVVGSLTSWVIKLKNGHWQFHWHAALVYIPLFILSVLLYRLLRIKLIFGSKEKRRLLSAYYEAKLVLGCGGGNLYANFWISPFFLLSLIALGAAIILGKRVVLLPQSVGPIKGWFQRRLASLILKKIDKIMVRESFSLEFLQAMNIQNRVILIPDLALASASKPANFYYFSPLIEEYPGRKIGVTVIDRAAQTRNKLFLPAQQERYEDTLSSALAEISRKYRAAIYLFSQCNGPDFAHTDIIALQRVFSRLRSKEVPVFLSGITDDFRILKAAYARMDCIVGSRMHTAIFALSAGIPTILIGYQPKAFGLMKWFGLDRFCYRIETLNQEQLIKGISELIEKKPEFSQLIKAKNEELQALLELWKDELRNYA